MSAAVRGGAPPIDPLVKLMVRFMDLSIGTKEEKTFKHMPPILYS